jgi:choline dehydrogenase
MRTEASWAKRIASLNYWPGPNADQCRGVAAVPLTISSGVRQSTGIAYLTEDVRRRPNLTIRGRTEVDRILVNGATATGVRTVDGTGYQAGQIILSAGSLGSAHILLRSGTGPARDLAELDIDVVADLPVGQRLQDQPVYHGVYVLAAGAGEKIPAAGAFIRTASSQAQGDELDLLVSAAHLYDPGISPTGGAIVLAVSVVRPESRGRLRLRSADPRRREPAGHRRLDPARCALRPDEPDRDHGGRAHLPARALPLIR